MRARISLGPANPGDAPDDRLNDMAHVREVLQKDYYNIQEPSQLGDLVLLSTRTDTVIHAAVHLADLARAAAARLAAAEAPATTPFWRSPLAAWPANCA